MDNWNRRLWGWLRINIFNIKEGECATGIALVTANLLHPKRYVLWKWNDQEGYNIMRDVWHIDGLDISGELMRHLGYGDDRLFKIVERHDKTVTIQTITPEEL